MSRHLLISLLIISLAAGLTLWYVTPVGLGLTNDSAAYLGGARSIAAGTGYSDIWLDSDLEAITHYPPLLSLLLAVAEFFGLGAYRAARLLNIFLWAANTGLMGLLGWKMTSAARWGIFLALLFALNAQLLTVHTYLLSEPLFLFFSLLSFLFFAQSQSAKNPNSYLFMAGVAASLATLTRYSGLALVATFLISTLLLGQTWREKLKKLAFFLAGVIPLLAAWFIRNRLVAESATNRELSFHPVLAEKADLAIYNVSQWLIPLESLRRDLVKSGGMEWILLLLGAILLLWVLSHAWKATFRPETVSLFPYLPFTTGLYIFGYLGAVLFSMSFFDASTKFQPRILSPLYVSWMVLFVWALKSAHGTYPGRCQRRRETRIFSFDVSAFLRAIRVPLILLCAIPSIAFSVYDFSLTTSQLRIADGQGYASWKWRNAQIFTSILALPPDVAIYTNSPPAVYLVIGRASRVLPTPLNPVSAQPRANYQADLAAMRAEILAGRAVLALFDAAAVEDESSGGLLNEYTTGLTILLKAQGDVLYGKP